MSKNRKGTPGGIKNSHLIGAGGGEIKKKTGETRAEQAAKIKGQPKEKWAKKNPPKAATKSHAEQVGKKAKIVKPSTITKPTAKPKTAAPKAKIVKPSTIALKSTTSKTPLKQGIRSVKQTMKPSVSKGIAKIKSMAKPAPKNVRPAAKTIKKSGPKR